jgi:hypothetical protein
MIRNWLRRLAKKHLDLAERAELTQERAIARSMSTEMSAANSSLKNRIIYLNNEIALMKQKYPTIWLGGDAAQGVVQLPRLKIACEFYREENKFCVFLPWEKAAGAKPEDLVPEWLEVDESEGITSLIDKQGGKVNGILFKIPVKGWLDTYDAVAADSHPSYSLDGRALEKTKSFRCKAGINGLYRREMSTGGKLYINLYFYEFDMPNPHRLNQNTVNDFVPFGGNMEFDPGRIDEWQFKMLGEAPDRFMYWRLPMQHVDKPRIGYDRKKYIAPKPTNNLLPSGQ